jgi:hypothetical protein
VFNPKSRRFDWATREIHEGNPTMANEEIENAVRNAAQTLERLLTDAATLTVTTNYSIVGIDAGAQPGQEVGAAKTVIHLDGDWEAAVPVRIVEGGRLEREAFLFDFHQENVRAATDYRAKIIGVLIDALRAVR